MKKLIVGVMAALMAMFIVTAPVQAVMVRETCHNDTHLNVNFNFDLTTGGTVTAYNYTQIHLCEHNCTNGKCSGTFEQGDFMAMWLVYASGSLLLILGTLLGIPFGKLTGQESIKPGWDTTVVVRYMFFFIGFYLLYLSLGMSRRITSLYGGDTNITGAAGTSTLVIMITMLLFLFVFIIELVFTYIKRISETKFEQTYGERVL